MDVLLVRSNKIGSRLIRWGLGEPVSHFAIRFHIPGVIYHAYGRGILRVDPADFHNEIVETIALPATDAEEILCEQFFKNCTGYQAYDYPALLYFTWRVALKKFFGVAMPPLNAWNVDDYDICTELAYMLGEAYAQYCGKMILPEGYDLAIVSPWQLGNLLKSRVAQLAAPQNPFR
jgi:hypothetical protein